MDRHKHAPQPEYHKKKEKIQAREETIRFYRAVTNNYSIPKDRGYWTLCNKQPNEEGSEIVQMVKSGLLTKKQFFGIDYDIDDEKIIEFNQKEHPEANWFKGDFMSVIEQNYDIFNPALIYFDYTATVNNKAAHKMLINLMNMCTPKRNPNTVIVANLMVSDGHSKRKFIPDDLIKSLKNIVQEWNYRIPSFSYKASQTDMLTFFLDNVKDN